MNAMGQDLSKIRKKTRAFSHYTFFKISKKYAFPERMGTF